MTGTEAPATTVAMWCHHCKGHVPIRPAHVDTRRKPYVYRIPPAALAEHRATHAATNRKTNTHA